MTTTAARSADRAAHGDPGGRLDRRRTSIARLLRRAWRRLRRMDTALVLLLGTAAATLLATIVPQRPTSPAVVEEWLAGVSGPGAGTAQALDALGLFDVLGSWWMASLVTLLLLSLAGCLMPRYRAFGRELRRPPPPGRNLERLRHHVVLHSAHPPEEVLERAGDALRSQRMRVRRIPAAAAPAGHGQIAAEGGHVREAGNLAFHTAILLVLAGVALASAGGFRGQVDVVEGERFAETAVVYRDALAGPGWSTGAHRGFTIGLERFDVRTLPDGTPAEFRADVTVDGRRRELRVGAPLRVEGMTVHLARHGVAPRVVIASGGRVLVDQHVLLRQAGPLAWAGGIPLRLGATAPAGHPDELFLRLVLLPDAAASGPGRVVRPSDQLAAPVLLAELARDDDGSPALGPAATVEVGGEAALLGGPLRLEFPEVRRWAGFQVSHVPGRWLLLGAAVLLLAGLTVSLHACRRRVWVEARATDDGTQVVLAGVVRNRAPAWEARWARTRTVLERALER